MAIVTETQFTATEADFAVPEHEHDFRIWPGVCRVCGVIGNMRPDTEGNFQDPFPSFGSDEHLTW